MPSVLFAAWRSRLDQSNDASISPLELLLGLSRRGWEVETFRATGKRLEFAKTPMSPNGVICPKRDELR